MIQTEEGMIKTEEGMIETEETMIKTEAITEPEAMIKTEAITETHNARKIVRTNFLMRMKTKSSMEEFQKAHPEEYGKISSHTW